MKFEDWLNADFDYSPYASRGEYRFNNIPNSEIGLRAFLIDLDSTEDRVKAIDYYLELIELNKEFIIYQESSLYQLFITENIKEFPLENLSLDENGKRILPYLLNCYLVTAEQWAEKQEKLRALYLAVRDELTRGKAQEIQAKPFKINWLSDQTLLVYLYSELIKRKFIDEPKNKWALLKEHFTCKGKELDNKTLAQVYQNIQNTKAGKR